MNVAARAAHAFEIPQDMPVVPASIAHPSRGQVPRFGMDRWDFRPWSTRSGWRPVADFPIIEDTTARLTAKQYLYSRLNRAVPLPSVPRARAVPMKLSNLAVEWSHYRKVFTQLTEIEVAAWREVTPWHLERLKEKWDELGYSGHHRATLIKVVQHVAAHSLYLTADTMTFVPWPGRAANRVADRPAREENTTPRVPEPVMGPMLKAALFYVETASSDILAGIDEATRLTSLYGQARKSGTPMLRRREAVGRIDAWIERRRAQGRGVPALPLQTYFAKRFTDPIIDGVAQAPNTTLACAMANLSCTPPGTGAVLRAAAAELGYEAGGMDTEISPWPETDGPWRTRFDPTSVQHEITYLRTACFIVIAFLSGARDTEVRELPPDCAFLELADDGVTMRHKLRGRVFKKRRVGGDPATWVCLEPVHRAVEVLQQLNDDPTHLFAYRHGKSYKMLFEPGTAMNRFRDHVGELFSTDDTPFIPLDAEQPWSFQTRQLRRTLAWYIAFQPFGVVGGARQYKHAKIATFEGYAGTSSSGFAAEVAAEEAIARLDMIEDLYRDWKDGRRAAGGAVASIHAEFERVQREVGDLPGIVAGERRVRAMLEHLSRVLHPGLLNDCFFKQQTAACLARRPEDGKSPAPLPMLSACVRCPNAYVTAKHGPRLRTARAEITDRLCAAEKTTTMPPLQRTAFLERIGDLDRFIAPLDQGADPEPGGEQ